MSAPPPGDGPGTVAVVPLRGGVSGKSRLAAALDPAARRRLVAALARHVVAVLLASDGVDGVLVVTADVPFAVDTLGLRARGGSARVEVVQQPPDRPGLNAALDVGREAALERGAARLLVAHADLPLLAPDDVVALLAAGAAGDAPAPVVVATDRHLAGTNLLVLPTRPPGDAPFAFRFGEGSRAAHVAEAERAGLRPVVVRRPGTAVDLDTVDDWGELPRAVRDRLRHGLDLPLP
ncbi:2-phospho-L-lactate guanylyltransferase [Krasilnikoviella flava]|uniref:Phosphoenolpyruvate guanylyltransferase n=1 Tax=Krasilnikoviella flava TaxID=526729 RepID=A0A1T5ILX4_9MICO|nr:2-phospho-L-lactate guanylyltransferase [Krasilnikoviella flava]SKC40008.1 2-phospho-L-lactate guanylyltransferase [Krasilnikoviella flava]